MLSKIIFVLMMVTIMSKCSARSKQDECTDPDMSKLKLDMDDLHDSFYQLPSMNHHVVNTSHPSQYVNIHHGFMHGPKTCPSFRNIEMLYDGHICPVYYVLNHDENRIPKSFVEARCSCRRPPYTSGSRDNNIYECAPLTKYTKVQRRISCDDKSGFYIYSPMWEILQIGCITMMQETVIRNGQRNHGSPKTLSG